MNKTFSIARGTADILPEEIHLWEYVENTARQILNNYNYQEIRTPIFEETELFARSMGQTSDVVQKQMLNLASQNKEDLAQNKLSGLSLRPEGTAAIVRSYIENSIDRKESLTKLFYIAPMFRGERPQKGRLRQFHQIGAEVLGPNSASPYLDAEMISLAVNILRSLGLNGFQLKINTLGSSADKESFSQSLREQIKPFLSQLSPEDQNRFSLNVFRILDSKDPQHKEIVSKLNLNGEYLSAESRQYFKDVTKALDNLGVVYSINPQLVRGLDYYTHTVFEFSDASLGSQDALGAGGRYSNLVSQLGGNQVDAIGFALGIERILLALPNKEQQKKKSITAYLIALDESVFSQMFQLLNQLRMNNVACDISYKLSSMRNQMRQADKTGAKFVLIMGENEAQKNVVTVKNMQSGEQQEISLSEKEKLVKSLA